MSDLHTKNTRLHIASPLQERVFLSVDLHDLDNIILTGTNDSKVIVYKNTKELR